MQSVRGVKYRLCPWQPCPLLRRPVACPHNGRFHLMDAQCDHDSLKEALAPLAAPWPSVQQRRILFDWFRSGRLVGELSVLMSVGIPTCEPRSIASTEERLAQLGERQRDPAPQDDGLSEAPTPCSTRHRVSLGDRSSGCLRARTHKCGSVIDVSGSNRFLFEKLPDRHSNLPLSQAGARRVSSSRQMTPSGGWRPPAIPITISAREGTWFHLWISHSTLAFQPGIFVPQ